jgi:hypothetical protein
MSEILFKEKKDYESIQRIIYVTLLAIGCCIFIFGIISLNFNTIPEAMHWAGNLGLGLIIFGSVGTYLTNPEHISKVAKEQEIIEEATNHRVSMTVYITNPYEAVLVMVFFLFSSALMCYGSVMLFNWIGSFF